MDPYRAQNSELLVWDLSAWVDALITPEPAIIKPPLGPGPGSYSSHPTRFYPSSSSSSAMWGNQIAAGNYLPLPVGQSPQALTTVNAMEENSGIQLVHALLTCAESIHRGEFELAAFFVDQMTNELLTRVNTSGGIGKVARYFIQALTRRLYRPAQVPGSIGSGLEYEVLYQHFYEACPYLKFSHFTANQAILDAFDGHDYVHIIDFGLIQGLQWPALLQALALRPGGPPYIRLTGIGPPPENGSISLHDIGSAVAQVARLVNVRFTFRALTVSRLQNVKPRMLETSPGEALAVNSILQLHRLIGSGINPVINMIRSLNPKVVTLVEHEANHNLPEFLPRFTEALHYYSTMFDSLESCPLQPVKALAELYLQREISNIVCHEGLARVERHEPTARWKARMARAGFRQLCLGQNAFSQASMLLGLFSAEGYYVEESEGCLKLGWHGRPLIAASAWQVDAHSESSSMVLDGSSSSSSSSLNN